MKVSKNARLKKVLLLGAVYPFCDLYDDIRSLGYEAVVCDYFPDAPCKSKADISYDVSTTDVPALIEIAKKHEVAGIVTAFSDRNLMPGYEVAKALGLPTLYTPETIKLVTDKLRMKEQLFKNGFPIIPYRIVPLNFCENELSGLNFPVVVKPVDGYGSKGVVICDSIDSVRDNAQYVLKNSLGYKDYLLVEEFYSGDEFTIQGWVRDGVLYPTCIYDVGKNKSKKDGMTYGFVEFPSKYANRHYTVLKKLAQELSDCMGVKNGPIAVQCYVGNKGLKVGEYLFRLPGSASYVYATLTNGPNTGKMLLQSCVGDRIDYTELENYAPGFEDKFIKYKLFCKPSKQLHFCFSRDKVLQQIREIIDIRIYRNDGFVFTSPLQYDEILMQIYCKANGKTNFISLLKRLDELLVVENEAGERISYISCPEDDWKPNEALYPIDL